MSLTLSWLHSAGVDMCYVLGSKLSAETSQMLAFLGEATCKGLEKRGCSAGNRKGPVSYTYYLPEERVLSGS